MRGLAWGASRLQGSLVGESGSFTHHLKCNKNLDVAGVRSSNNCFYKFESAKCITIAKALRNRGGSGVARCPIMKFA